MDPVLSEARIKTAIARYENQKRINNLCNARKRAEKIKNGTYKAPGRPRKINTGSPPTPVESDLS